MRRAPLLMLAPLAALSLAACGDDDDDDEPTDTTEETTEATTEDATEETTEDATEETSDEITIPDISISIPDLDITIPDLSVPNAEEIIADVFPDLDEDQVSCLADAFEGETPSVDQVMDLLDDCNINPSDLVPG